MSYQIAWIHGDLVLAELGTTAGGTALQLWTEPAMAAEGLEGKRAKAKEIVSTWVITIPGAGTVSVVTYLLANALAGVGSA